MNEKFQLRRDTSANWSLYNPILAQGEPGYALDLGVLKIGDGATAWDDLKGITGGSGGALGTDFVLVGDGGDYATIAEAFAEFKYDLFLLPGTHAIAARLDIDMDTHPTGVVRIIGSDKSKCIIEAADSITASGVITFSRSASIAPSGLVSWALGSNAIVGNGSCAFTTEFAVGDYFRVAGVHQQGRVIEIVDDNNMIVDRMNDWAAVSLVTCAQRKYIDLYMENVSIRRETLTTNANSFFEHWHNDAGANLFITNVDDYFENLNYDNFGRTHRYQDYHQYNTGNWGMYTPYDTKFENCTLQGYIYAYDGAHFNECMFLNVINFYLDQQVMFTACYFPDYTLSGVTGFNGAATQWVAAFGCFDFVGRFSSNLS